MKIYVCVKQVPDTETKIKLNSDSTWIDTNGIKWILSPYDEFAVEEALKVKEANDGSEVVVVSAGPERVKEAMRTALAMGADRGIHVDIPERSDSHLAAKALAGALKKEEKVDIVFTGKEAIDDGAAQVSQIVGELLDLPTVTVVQKIEYSGASIKCTREVEGGTFETTEVNLPGVVAAQKGLNEPRYASLPNIMKAKKKEIKTLAMADAGVSESDQKLKYTKFRLPPAKQEGKKIEGEAEQQVKDLVKLLHEEAKVV